MTLEEYNSHKNTKRFIQNLKFLIQIILCILNNISENKNYVLIFGSFTEVADKPVAFLKASKSIVANTIGGMFGKASSIWSWGKNDKGIVDI